MNGRERAVGEHARQRVLVAMSGGVDSSAAAALLVEQGADVVGVWMRLHDGADVVQLHEPLVLLARRRGRRAPRGRPAGHPVLRPEPRTRVRGRRARSLRGRVPRGPHPEPLRGLQLGGQVRGAPGAGAAPLRLRRRGHRPLRAGGGDGRRGPPGRPAFPPAGRRRSRQGPELLPLRAAAGAAGARPLPARRAAQAGGPRAGAPPRPRDGRQAREPGDLLRARRGLPR